MGVGEILLTSPEAGVTFAGGTEYKKSAPPTNASVNTVLGTKQRASSESKPGEAKQDSDKARHTIEDLLGANSELSIAVDQATREIVVKVINSDTHEVIRQIPPEEALRLAHTLKKLQGVLLDEVA
jgi:flagellar protein FlaG